MNYILSVVIPTRNRQKYMINTLLQVLSNTNEKVEIIIQDNSDTNELETIVNDLNICRIKYNYQRNQLSFVDNFSKAVEMTTGEYVIIIGDDDGVLPEIIKYSEYASENNIDVLVPSITFEYFWPNSVTINGRRNGVIRYMDSNTSILKIDGNEEIIKLLKNGCQDYTYLKTAKIYHGIVKRDKLEKIKNITGSIFGGLTPDIYMAVCLSLISNSIYYLSIPLTIAGVCPASGSAQASNGSHVGKYEDSPHLIGHDNYSWSKLVPKFYSVETIWADSALAAINNLRREELLKHYSVEAITGRLLYLYNEFSDIIFDNYNLNSESYKKMQKIRAAFIIKTTLIRDIFNKVLRRIKRINKKVYYIYGIEDISKATLVYTEKFSNKKEKSVR